MGHRTATSSMILLFLLCLSPLGVLSRPLEEGSKPYRSPISLPYITEHVTYWFHHIRWRGAPQYEAPAAGGVGDPDGDAEAGRSPFGLGGYGGLGGWGWGENEITVVVINICRLPLFTLLADR